MNRFAKWVSVCVVSIVATSVAGEAAAAPPAGGRQARPAPREDERGPKGRPGPNNHGPQRGPQRGPQGRNQRRPSMHRKVFRAPPAAPAVEYIGEVVKMLARANRKASDEKMKQALTDVCIAERLIHISVEEPPPPPAAEPAADAAEAAPKAKPAPHRGVNVNVNVNVRGGARRAGHKRPSKGMAICRKVKDDEAKAAYKAAVDGVTGLTTGKRGVAVAFAQRSCELGKSLGAAMRCDLPRRIDPKVVADVKLLKDRVATGEKEVKPVEAAPAEVATAATEAAAATTEVAATDAKEETETKAEETVVAAEDKAAEKAADPPAATDAPATDAPATDAPATDAPAEETSAPAPAALPVCVPCTPAPGTSQ